MSAVLVSWYMGLGTCLLYTSILKAAAGGGGRGMRRCDSPEEVRTAYELVHSEAEKAFGCGDIFMEKYLVEPKHIEVQILADQHGNVYHLGERDLSLIHI